MRAREVFTLDARHVVVDIETLGLHSSARIVSLGAVALGAGASAMAASFYMLVDLDGLNADRSEDPSTVRWWDGQSAQARLALHYEQRQPLEVVLGLFAGWVLQGTTLDQVRMWGNGDEFDLAILADAYAQCRVLPEGSPWTGPALEPPWLYWHGHNLRTIAALFPQVRVPTQAKATKHNALHDARHEAGALRSYLRAWEAGRDDPPALPDSIAQARPYRAAGWGA